MKKLSPAQTLEEAYKALDPEKYLDPAKEEDRRRYVPLFKEEMKEIAADLLMNENSTLTICVTGQSGSGKTSALNFLMEENPRIKEKYSVVSIYFRDELDLGDVDITHILFTIAAHLIREEDSLRVKFEEKLKEIKASIEGRLDQVVQEEQNMEANAAAGIKAALNSFFSLFGVDAFLSTRFKVDSSYREITKKAFVYGKTDLQEAVNEVIVSYQKKKGKKLLLILNELDHMKRAEDVESIFNADFSLLSDLVCVKVISVPVVLLSKTWFTPAIFVLLNTYLDANPLDKGDGRSCEVCQRNRTCFKEVLKKRVNPALFEKGVVEAALEASGGVVRQFLHILHRAVNAAYSRADGKVEGVKISLGDLAKAKRFVAGILETSVLYLEKIRLLKHIADENVPATGDGAEKYLIECILANQILVHQNGDTWYVINPLIKGIVEKYAEKIEKKEGKGEKGEKEVGEKKE